MNKKLPITVALLLTLGYFVYYLGLFWGDQRFFFRAVPESAVLIMETDNMDKLRDNLKDTNYWLDLQNVDWINKIEDAFVLMDTILLKDTPIGQKKIVSSLHLTKADDYDYLLIMREKVLPKDLARVMRDLKRGGFQIRSRTFRDTEIYELRLDDLKKPFTLASHNGMIIGSFSAILVDESVTQGRSGQNTTYRSMSGWRNKKTDATVYINFKNVGFLSGVFLKKRGNSIFHQLQEWIDWTQLDIAFNDKTITVNGNTLFNSDNRSISRLLKQGVGDTKITIPELLPFNTALLMHNRVASMERFYKKRERTSAASFEKNFLPWLGGEWAYGFTEPNSSDFSNGAFIINSTQDTKEAAEKLAEYSKAKATKYAGYEIRTINAYPVAAQLYNEAVAQTFREAYYAVVGNHAIFTSKKTIIKLIIDQGKSGQTLAKEKGYINFIKQQDPESNSFVYLQPSKMYKLLKDVASPQFAKSLEKKFTYYERVSPLAFSFDKSGGKALTKGIATYQKASQEKTTMVWNVQLEDEAARIPQIMRNYDTGHKEILVQDKSNNVYLLSRDGDVIWKRHLDEAILDKVFQLDFYGNKEYQYLFNTKNKIYLLDRQGENEYNYPIRLSSEANAGLTMIELPSLKKYNFFIPCNNGNVYGYEHSGKPLSGWSPRRKLLQVPFPLTQFRGKGKDYLVAANKNGTIFFLNRRGSIEHKITPEGPLMSAPKLTIRDGEQKIIATDTKGYRYLINSEGRYKTKRYTKSTNNKSKFLTANMLGTDVEESILLNKGRVSVFNDKEELFTYRLANFKFGDDFEISDVFAGEQINKISQIGIFSKATKEIVLLEKYGKFHADFPLKASTPFATTDLFNSGEKILVAGGVENNIYAYKIK